MGCHRENCSFTHNFVSHRMPMSMPVPFFPGNQQMGGFKSFSKKGGNKNEVVQDTTQNTNSNVVDSNINANTN